MKKYAKPIIVIQTVLIACLVTLLFLPRITAYIGSMNWGTSKEDLISSHFYEFGLVNLAPDLKLPWVSGTSDGNVLAMSADSGFGRDGDTLLGASDPIHSIYLVEPNTRTYKKVAEINFLDAVFGEGKWPEDYKHRSLDFISSPFGSDSRGKCSSASLALQSRPDADIFTFSDSNSQPDPLWIWNQLPTRSSGLSAFQNRR
jgi:hypothetical protein